MQVRRILTPEERQLIIEWTEQGITAREQAERLGMPYPNFLQVRKSMTRKGLLTVRPRPPFRLWTKRDLFQLDTLLERGYSIDIIAQKMNRTRHSIMTIFAKRKKHILGQHLLTRKQITTMLGLFRGDRMIGMWIKWGWLKAVDRGSGRRTIYGISHDALWAFMENSEYWYAWDPAKIPDPALREWAYELRANAPAWLTTRQVAERLYVSEIQASRYMIAGILQSVWYKSQRFVREDWLESFTLPSELPKAQRPTVSKMRVTPIKVRRLKTTEAA